MASDPKKIPALLRNKRGPLPAADKRLIADRMKELGGKPKTPAVQKKGGKRG